MWKLLIFIGICSGVASVEAATMFDYGSGTFISFSTSALSFSVIQSSSVQGTSTNDNAPAGFIGEYISTKSVSSLSLTNSASFYVYLSTSLSKGDWDVTGIGVFNPNGSSSVTNFYVAISTYGANVTTDHVLGDNVIEQNPSSLIGGNIQSLTVTNYRISLSNPQTVYFKTRADFVSGTPLVIDGRLSARRPR
jgi:hypothetical protein